MKKIGIITYDSLHCNFTNYGTALQTWALTKAIKKIAGEIFEPVLLQYYADSMRLTNPLNPMENMMDIDERLRIECSNSLDAIKVNYEKFVQFYKTKIGQSLHIYNSDSLARVLDEDISLFVCGSDSIWDILEFGMDKGYWANIPCMKRRSIAYAPSFQDTFYLYKEKYSEFLKVSLDNYLAVGVRDSNPLAYLQKIYNGIIKKVVDPTLLLESQEYDEITGSNMINEKYILYYSRRYDSDMDKFVDRLSEKTQLKVIEISIIASNAKKRSMFYEAGVEEFLALVKNAQFVVTNSFHCIIFAIQFKRNFWAFTRERCNTKIYELLERYKLTHRWVGKNWSGNLLQNIDYKEIRFKLSEDRNESLNFLKEGLDLLDKVNLNYFVKE